MFIYFYLIGSSISIFVVLCILIFAIIYLISNLKNIFNNITRFENSEKLLNSQIGNIYNKGAGNNLKEFMNRKLPEYNVLKQLNENENDYKEKLIMKNQGNNNENEYNKVNEKSNISDRKNNSFTDIMSNKKQNNVSNRPSKTENNNEKNSMMSSGRELKSIDIEDLNSFISIPKENSISIDVPKENSFDN